MSQDQSGPGRARLESGNDGQANERPGADAQAPAPTAGGLDAQSSNTASKSYKHKEEHGECEVRILRIGIDSLYLSYYGELSPDTDNELGLKKLLAQSRNPKDQAQAQWVVNGHIFEVSDKGQRVQGQGGFAYILQDNAFRIALSSSSSRALPLAYVQVSSEYLAHVGPEVAVQALTAVIATFGDADKFPTVSRVDLFADLQSNVDMESFERHAWITRAGSINTYSVKGQFTGYTIGAGGPISSRLYNKTLEILKSHKTYLFELWKRAGMDPDRHVWRQEFQVKREVLTQLSIHTFENLIERQGGIWGYAAQTWLRLSIPQAGDTNHARWPTHPLWDRIADIRWRLDDVPLTRRFALSRKPHLDRLYRMLHSLLSSFMACEKITDEAEGLRQFLDRARAFLESMCQDRLGIAYPEWLAMEVAVKAKKYNTFANVPSPEEEADTSEEVDGYAIDYYRASRGD